jgi:Putative zinc-finger
MGRNECERARERVSLELDGELSLHEAALLARHLSGCPACALFAGDVRRHTDLLRAAPLEQAGPFALPRRGGATRLSVRVGAVVGSAAAAALVAVSVLPFTKPSGNHGQIGLVFAPSLVPDRAGGGPFGLRHPSAAKPAVSRPGILDSPQHSQIGS